MEPIPKPTPGHWYWKEDTKTLEFSRASNTSLQRIPECTELDKVTKSPRLGRIPDNRCVTLDDAKGVALNMLEEQERNCIASFSLGARNHLLNDFLMALLNYLSCFLEKHSDKNPKSLMPRMIILEKDEADLKMRTEIALKHFAHMYCILVLGEGVSDQHQLGCGSRASFSKQEWIFYESLYNYTIKVAWVVFRRRELNLIQEEVGRLLRSNTFNPALRKQDAPSEPSKNLSGRRTSKKRAVYAEKGKILAKRPAIHDIVTQRSPALTSLIPSPKEKAQYLFQQHELHPKGSAGTIDVNTWLESSSAISTLRIGILGEPLKQFNRHSLLPIGDEDDEEQEMQEKKNMASSHSGPHSPTRPATGRHSLVSRATTEAVYSDTE
ncbi:protein phosphatase 1 regulatory subunit 36 isoform X2 [Rana temporaria]|uniref:protein phosphatase 1 regulatory subunit 36 isoform X2 n=1 Tax=Rana temporaria TaxID=8407 RepID=UPI001AACE579|nr:protein phosphatase 1 regulatory subunit 36 isoform X2 [Rana temporaria]